MVVETYEMATYELADIGTRLAAWLIDGAILFIIESASFFALREVGFAAGFIIALVYSWFFLTRNKGQTPGKVIMKIRVIKTDGDAVIRYIGYILNFVGCIGWLWVLFDVNRQGWHDKLAHTYVVKTEG